MKLNIYILLIFLSFSTISNAATVWYGLWEIKNESGQTANDLHITFKRNKNDVWSLKPLEVINGEFTSSTSTAGKVDWVTTSQINTNDTVKVGFSTVTSNKSIFPIVSLAYWTLDGTETATISLDPNPFTITTKKPDEFTKVVPLPAAFWLMDSGILGLLGFRHKNKVQTVAA